MVTTYYAKWLLKNNPPNLTTQKPNCASPNSIPCYVIMGDEKNTENIYIYIYICHPLIGSLLVKSLIVE